MEINIYSRYNKNFVLYKLAKFRIGNLHTEKKNQQKISLLSNIAMIIEKLINFSYENILLNSAESLLF